MKLINQWMGHFRQHIQGLNKVKWPEIVNIWQDIVNCLEIVNYEL